MTIYINVIFCFTDQEYIELLTVWRKQGKKIMKITTVIYKLWCLIYITRGSQLKNNFINLALHPSISILVQ